MATLQSLINATHARNEKEKTNYKWLVLIDEIQIFKYSNDFTTLSLKESIEIMAAINPNRTWQSDISPPKDKKFIFKRLTFKHRNSLEISIFLAHWKWESKQFSFADGFNGYEDESLLKSCFPAIDKVIW